MPTAPLANRFADYAVALRFDDFLVCHENSDAFLCAFASSSYARVRKIGSPILFS